MSSLAPIQLIQPQRVDFDTTQQTDWLDGLPLIGTPDVIGTLASPSNTGKAGLVVSAASGTARGVHKVTVAAIVNGVVDLTVTAPDGTVTGFGAAGLTFYAGGLTLALTQIAGQATLAVDDTFLVSVGPRAIDLTGLRFDLDARLTVGGASYALQATSDGPNATIASGGPLGVIAMVVPRATMARLQPRPEGYPYGITATDPVSGLTVPAFCGLIHHTAAPAQIGQGV